MSSDEKLSSLRLNSEATTTSLLWRGNQPAGSELVVAEVPTLLQRWNLLSGSHLLQLEEAFAQVAYSAHRDACSLYEASLVECPDIVLHHSDEYMAGVINRVSQNASSENIFVLCGYGQSRSIAYHLFYNPRVFAEDSVSQVTKFNPVFKTLIREDT